MLNCFVFNVIIVMNVGLRFHFQFPPLNSLQIMFIHFQDGLKVFSPYVRELRHIQLYITLRQMVQK